MQGSLPLLVLLFSISSFYIFVFWNVMVKKSANDFRKRKPVVSDGRKNPAAFRKNISNCRSRLFRSFFFTFSNFFFYYFSLFSSHLLFRTRLYQNMWNRIIKANSKRKKNIRKNGQRPESVEFYSVFFLLKILYWCLSKIPFYWILGSVFFALFNLSFLQQFFWQDYFRILGGIRNNRLVEKY